MGSIDRADWHYGGDFSKELPKENGGTHIGMYLTWIIHNNLIGETHLNDSIEVVNSIKARLITGREFLFNNCDEKFWDEDLNEEGLKFTKSYYQDPKDPNGGFGEYIDDYVEALGEGYDSIYEIPNSWENYEIIAKIIDERFRNWKAKLN